MSIKSGMIQIAIGIVLMLVLWTAIGIYGHAREQAGYTQAQTEYQVAVGQAEAKTRKVEHQLQEEMEQREREIQTQMEEIIATERRAADERVRSAAEDYAARYRRDTAIASASIQRQAANSALSMFTELLSELDELAEGYAAEADKRRAAGLACEQSYDSVRIGARP